MLKGDIALYPADSEARAGTHKSFLGRYGEAITECERAASHANFWSIHEFLTAAYALKGDMERARAAKERLLRARPRFTISWIEGYVALQHPTWQDQFKTHVIAGLRKAGVPER